MEGDPSGHEGQQDQFKPSFEAPKNDAIQQPEQSETPPVEEATGDQGSDNPEGVLKIQKNETDSEESQDTDGRYDIDKARAIGLAINESGDADYSDDEEYRLFENAARKPAEAQEEYDAGIEEVRDDYVRRMELAKDSEYSSEEEKQARLEGLQQDIDHPENSRLARDRDITGVYEDRLDRNTDVVERIKDRRMNRIRGRDDFYEEIYNLSPERFKDMPTPEFIKVAQEYGELLRSLEASKDALNLHERFIDAMDEAIKNRSSQVLEGHPHSEVGLHKHIGETLRGHYATDTVVYGYADRGEYVDYIKHGRISFSLGELVEHTEDLLDEQGEEGKKTLLADAEKFRESGEAEKADVYTKIIELGDTFGLSPLQRIEGYRDAVASYWKPKTEAAIKEAEAKVEEYKAKFKEAGQAPEQPAS